MQAVHHAGPLNLLSESLLKRRMIRSSIQRMVTLGQASIETMDGHPGRREVFTDALFANALAQNDVLLLNLRVDMVGLLQVPAANFTLDSMVSEDPIAVVVVTPTEGRPHMVTMVATIPEEAMDSAQNWFGPAGTKLELPVTGEEVMLSQAGADVSAFYLDYLAGQTTGNMVIPPPMLDNIDPQQDQFLNALHRASSSTVARDTMAKVNSTSHLYSPEKWNKAFNPSHDGPERGPSTTFSATHGKNRITELILSNLPDKNNIGDSTTPLNANQLDSFIKGEWGFDKMNVLALGRLPNKENPTLLDTMNSTDECMQIIRPFMSSEFADAIGELSACLLATILLGDEEGTQLAELVNYYIQRACHPPPNLGMPEMAWIRNVLFHVQIDNPVVQRYMQKRSDLRISRLDAQVKANAASMAAMAANKQTERGTLYRGSNQPAGRTAYPNPRTPQGAGATTAQSTLGKRKASNAAAATSFVKATKGLPCNNPRCKGNHAYQHADPTSHAEVVAWIKSSPFGK